MNKGLSLIEEINKTRLKTAEIAFWWIGQMGYVVKLGEVVIYLDPFLSNILDRNIPPLLEAKEIKNADFIIGSHDHIDHIDRNVWHQLSVSSPNAKFVVPKLLIKDISLDLNIPEQRFIGLDDCESVSEKGLKMTGIAAAHEFLDRDGNSGSYPYLGYVMEGNGCTIYHSGDTCIYEGLHHRLRKWNKLDVIFVPINGRDAKRYRENCIGNMTYQEAVDLAGNIRPNLVVPGHYEMFTSNSVDPLLFADYMDVKYPEINYWIGKHGEKVLIAEALSNINDTVT